MCIYLIPLIVVYINHSVVVMLINHLIVVDLMSKNLIEDFVYELIDQQSIDIQIHIDRHIQTY